MGNLRPGGYAADDEPVRERGLVPLVTSPIPPNAFETMLRAVETVRSDMAGRDAELHDALVRIAQLYERMARRQEVQVPAAAIPQSVAAPDDDALRTLLRSIDTLATVTEASISRASDLSRSVQHLVEALQGLTNRVDNLVWRADVADARLEGVGQAVDALGDQVAMVGRRLGSPAARPRPNLRAVGRDEAPPASLP